MKKTTRLLLCAALPLLGGCDLLWAPFQGPNPTFCDPTAAACGAAVGEGGAPQDASTDAAGALGDGGAAPDLAGCKPVTPSSWVAAPIPPMATNVALSGVTGNGSGAIWVVGPTAYAAYFSGTSWTQLTIPTLAAVTSLGRLAYSAAAARALGPADCLAGECVTSLSASAATSAGIEALAALGGIWVGAGATGTAYVVSNDGGFQSSSDGTNWTPLMPPAPANLNVLSGPPLGGAAQIWGISTSGKVVTQYASAGSKWNTVSSGTQVFNSIWYGPSNLVWLVGNGGVIMTAPATVAPSGTFTQGPSLVNTALNDVAGTKDGGHLFVVGAAATILHYESKCQTWSKETSPILQDLNALWIDDAKATAWAVGASGTVLYRSIP